MDQVAAELARMPGIGPRSARRLVQHLLRASRDEPRKLARLLVELADRVRPCGECGTLAEEDRCAVCANPRRDRTTVCVVEGPFDTEAIERTGRFQGVYHVLGGRLSPLDGIGPEDLAIGALERRIREGEGIREVIVATNPSLEGEATAVYLQEVLQPLGVRVTRLARGLPVGSDLEYVDGTTLAEALHGRREMTG